MKISTTGVRMIALYAHFGRDCDNLDWSESAVEAFHRHESIGGTISERNGYAHGKSRFNLMVKNWSEGLREWSILPRDILLDKSIGPWLDIIAKELSDVLPPASVMPKTEFIEAGKNIRAAMGAKE